MKVAAKPGAAVSHQTETETWRQQRRSAAGSNTAASCWLGASLGQL